ncbi:MAG: LTA synthase family protein [Clostridia bacterium]|nr:LTA synthase family protein [Clostridia bacterium]
MDSTLKQQKLKIKLKPIVFPIVTIIFLELILHIATIFSINFNIFIPILFSIPLGLFISVICSIFSEKTNGIIYCSVIGVISLFFIIQLVYHEIFQQYLQIYLFKIGGNAIINFWRNMIFTVLQLIFVIILLALPFIFTVKAVKKKKLVFEKIGRKRIVIRLALIAVLHLICLSSLIIGGTGPYSNYSAYFSNSANTDISVNRLGVMTTARLEIANIVFPDLYNTSKIKLLTLEEKDPENENEVTETEEPIIIDNEKPKDEVDTPIEYSSDKYNVIDIDFDKLISQDTDENLKTLDTYFKNVAPTPKNEYTGIFKNCNLIMLCCESFSKYFISPTLTPTLYKLSTEGFVFNNFYSPFDSNTTNGEYAFNMGCFPDLLRSKTDNSFIGSSDNYLPYVLGNMFKSAGVQGYAYHNYYGTYYSRYLSHPNMGYIFKAPDSGLAIPVSWPSSDYDMMVASADDYISSDKQFLAYYMTFSGHYQYNWNNVMSAKNRSLVEGLDYTSETVLSYIACNLELEKALTYIMDRLVQLNIDKNTVIVLTNDHYPYGLSETEYNELAGKEIDTDFGRYQNSFICWYGGFDKPIEIDTPCSSIDILPTLLNLFGFTYDSRLILGKDILADCDHIAILSNKSFINDRVMLNGNTGKCTYLSENEEDYPDEKQLTQWQNYVEDIFTLSKAILDYDYYGHLREFIDPEYEQTSEEETLVNEEQYLTGEQNS